MQTSSDRQVWFLPLMPSVSYSGHASPAKSHMNHIFKTYMKQCHVLLNFVELEDKIVRMSSRGQRFISNKLLLLLTFNFMKYLFNKIDKLLLCNELWFKALPNPKLLLTIRHKLMIASLLLSLMFYGLIKKICCLPVVMAMIK